MIWDFLRKPEYQTVIAESRRSGSGDAFDIHQVPVDSVRLRPESRIVTQSDPSGCAADRLRFLRLRLTQIWNPEKLKKLLITSPQPHDGKSTIAVNLAVTLSEGGKRTVLLIDGDLHRATISRELSPSYQPGVAESLESGADPRLFIRRIEPLGCYLLPAGKATRNPSELLQGPALPNMMESLSRHFDWILIDSPPVAPLTDTLSWKERADATLLVVRAGSTPTGATEEALDLIGRKHVLAIVLNGVEGLDRVYKKYYNAYNSDSPR